MSSKIRVLDENTINKIAAGEVIENPSSVVKELVENSIDAGATEITIEIRGGGRQLIRITDNGSGMSQDDALLCFERHATSKIFSIDELFLTETMGFRGEAIPSIASISKLTLLTCPKDQEEGTLVIVDGGNILKCSKAVCNPGTTFEIKNLFYNLPVRKKFQRSPAYDANEILKVVSCLALAHPEIKFQLINNQDTVLSARISNLNERIRDVLGSDFSSDLCHIDRQHREYHLSGTIGLPSNTRHNRTGQFLFINKRVVVSQQISYAVKNGYGTSLPVNRHPIFVLFLKMDPSLVDVNVHPQKREVRLRHPQQLKEMITFSIEEALQNSGYSFPLQEEHPIHTPVFHFTKTPSLPLEPPPEAIWKPLRNEPRTPQEAWQVKTATLSLLPEKTTEQKEIHASYNVCAVLPGYLLLASENGSVAFLDQSAAHARILYEHLLDAEEKKRDVSVQSQLIPYTLELLPPEAELMNHNLEELKKAGFQVEAVGPNSFVIHSLPSDLYSGNIQDLVMDILDELSHLSNEHSSTLEIKKRIAKTAGKQAIKQNKRLTLSEAQTLFSKLLRCRSPSICPFGKRTIIEMPLTSITKQFQQ